MLIKNYEEVVQRLKPKLVDYLEDQGINTRKHFLCLSPEHNDNHPSMSVVPQSDFTRAFCHSCHAVADIFDACSALEDKPSKGPDYIKETIVYLANKYGIQVEEKELTEEEKYKFDCYSAYKDAAHYIGKSSSQRVKDYIKERGWSVELSAQRLIGSVPSFEEYKSFLKSAGYAVSFLEQIDLLNHKLFNEDSLIFTISDGNGRPCGFSARNLSWESNKDSPKYINTSAKCPIYEKSKRLYNLHNVRKEKGTIYLVEGCSDTEGLVQKGIPNVVGIGGTAFTEYHPIELNKLGKNNITIMTDGDEPGVAAANRILEKFNEHRDFEISIIILPDELDPDDFVNKYGTEELLKLRKWSAFEWKLNSYDDRIETSLIQKEIIPIIAAHLSAIEREKMIKILSEKIGISFDAIKEEVQNIIDEKELNRSKERDNILKEIQTDLRVSPTSWRQILNSGITNLEAISEKHSEDNFSPSVFVSELREQKDKQESLEEKLVSCNFWKWKEFQNAIDGDHEGTLEIIGGSANVAKTTMMANLAFQLATCPTDLGNYMVAFHTIDDTKDQFVNRLVSLFAREKYKEISLNMISKPNRYPQAKIINDARLYGYQKLEELINTNRLLLCSGEGRDQPTLAYANEMVKYSKKVADKLGDERQVVYFLDNFHRLRDFQGTDERIRFKKLSNGIKDMAKQFKIPTWATMEYNKTVGTTRPTNNSISESAAMEYDANLIMHLYNDMHVKNQLGEDPQYFHERIDHNGIKYKAPRIEAIIGKNKLNSFKGSLWFNLYGDQSYLEPVSADIVEREAEASIKRDDNNADRNQGFRKN